MYFKYYVYIITCISKKYVYQKLKLLFSRIVDDNFFDNWSKQNVTDNELLYVQFISINIKNIIFKSTLVYILEHQGFSLDWKAEVITARK